MPLNIAAVKLIVFINGLFANNWDLSLQIGFIFALVNKEPNSNAT